MKFLYKGNYYTWDQYLLIVKAKFKGFNNV
jgi:hypothetical protein